MNNNYNIFISYPDKRKDIVENLRGRLKEYNIKAWVYSRDKTYSSDTWNEIENRICNCKVFIYAYSEHSEKARGQTRELEFVLNIKNKKDIKILPIVIGEASFSDLPKELKYINGLDLDAINIKSCTYKIVDHFFPEIISESKKVDWKYPKPGQWLEVCQMDHFIEEFFNIGDQVYFRRISPMGLFECYSPQIKGLYWFYPPNLKFANLIDEDNKIEKERVPQKYHISTMVMNELKYSRKISDDNLYENS